MKQINSPAISHRINAKVAGVFFIMATLSAIVGYILYGPVLTNSDYLIQGAGNSNQIVLGAFFELVLACSNVGTAIMLYPFLRKYSESWGLGYVCFRMLEVVFILIGIVSVLALLSLSLTYTNSNAPHEATFQTLGKTLIAIHDWTFMLGPNFMLGINTFIYSTIFYRTGLVPRKLSVFGMIGAVLIFIVALLEIFGVIQQISVPGVLLGFPIAVYEMVLAIWLLRVGFNLSNETIYTK